MREREREREWIRLGT